MVPVYVSTGMLVSTRSLHLLYSSNHAPFPPPGATTLIFEAGSHSVAQAGQPLSAEITGVSQQAQPGFYFPLETGSCCVAQASLKLKILLPQPPECGDCWLVPFFSTFSVCLVLSSVLPLSLPSSPSQSL